jgi:hypothetical protein
MVYTFFVGALGNNCGGSNKSIGETSSERESPDWAEV